MPRYRQTWRHALLNGKASPRRVVRLPPAWRAPATSEDEFPPELDSFPAPVRPPAPPSRPPVDGRGTSDLGSHEAEGWRASATQAPRPGYTPLGGRPGQRPGSLAGPVGPAARQPAAPARRPTAPPPTAGPAEAWEGEPWSPVREPNSRLCYNPRTSAPAPGVALEGSGTIQMREPAPVPLRDRSRRRRRALPDWMLGTLVGVFGLVTVLVAFLTFATVRDLTAGWKVTRDKPATPIIAAGGGDQGGGGQGGGAATALPGSAPVPTVAVHGWTGTDRVTVLVMGIDRRVGEDEKGYLTDTMLLVSVDPVARTAAMLSIPRDLWVEIPDGFGVDTINTANRTGDYYDYPGGGPALAVKTVEHNLGVTVNYYVRMDFTAFETLIDTIDGIDIDNPTDIDDPYYPNGSYGFEPFTLAAGEHHLNGHDALRYARTRHGNSDIDRAQRQQQVAMAVRDRVLRFDMLPTLIARAPALYQTLNDSVWTDMSLEQMVSLALLAQDIPRENIRSAVIDFRYVLDYETPEGRQVLVPLRDRIRELRDELFSNSAATGPRATADDVSLMADEAAKVEVLNGAGVDGLARSTAEWLTEQGVNVVAFDTADRPDYGNSVIVDYTGKPYTVRWLQQTFGVDTIISGADPNSPVDVRIILGANWQIPEEP